MYSIAGDFKGVEKELSTSSLVEVLLRESMDINNLVRVFIPPPYSGAELFPKARMYRGWLPHL